MSGDCWISIHALREEGDHFLGGQSLLFEISIHALREEGDQRTARGCAQKKNFNPRPPRGGRLDLSRRLSILPIISIHALREEGDFSSIAALMYGFISIHALREEGDHVAGGIAG